MSEASKADPPASNSQSQSLSLSNGKPLRESSHFDDIYKSISSTSEASHQSRPKSHRRSSLGSDEGPSYTIGNPIQFLFSRDDPLQLRYSDEGEMERDRAEYVPSEDEREDIVPNGEGEQQVEEEQIERNQTLSSFLPSMFRNADHAQNINDEDKKSKRKFHLFRKRTKDREKKQSIITIPDEEPEQEDEDLFTGQRAQQLVGALAFGPPAISLMASCLLEDETGLSRAPLLLSLLGFRVTDISNTILTKNRKFRIDLEYGVGPQRMKWSVERTAKDLLYLHSRFKLDNWRKEVVRNKNSELPKYPIPPLRRNNQDGNLLTRYARTNSIKPALNEYLNHEGHDHQHEDMHSAISLGQLASLRAHLSHSSASSSELFDQNPEALRVRISKNQDYIHQVVNYLNELIKLVALKPQSNRLFHFLEISPISSLLSYETGFIGKQGVVHIGGTAKSQGWRVGHFKANDLKGMIDRRSEKWLLVRNSYIMYVSDINSTLPLEVFLVDHKFRITYKGDQFFKDDDDSDYDDDSVEQKVASENGDEAHKHAVFKHLKIVIENSERKLSLLPKSQKEQKLWINSLFEMKNSTVWSKKNRFDSFAPVRDNCYAQWFVDGRDYFWAISSAIEMAKDVVYIHDWWLSPELYLRRPANGNQQWRIDRLLQRKAKQGVKIFVILYRNVGSTVSTDSLYTKHSLLSLHDENIHVIRSPNQLLQNTYFWAHHEKLCVVDSTVAFIGGIDLCYGRFDTPDHVITDDSGISFSVLDNDHVPTEQDFTDFQIFPGKDYSNPRVKDFFGLDKPYESMYDRTTTPRMPWHDVHMLTSGKVARDLARHFVQRWNYLLRQKRPSRFTPLLTPPSDFTEQEEKLLNLGGSCEVQLLRSSGNWSLGLKEHEQSIQNAYLKLIETSEHFVYIENQFFVTSCEIDGNEIENRIGDALVDRIIRAHNEGTPWRAVIIIPLMPGFQSQVDQPDASSMRVIMQCQFMSISRGQTSIFAKLRKYGIEPDDYIQFFSLRKWGRIGPNRTLVTEQLYIHAKIMIIDDRAAIIGSANINERSMRGIRDSEMAALVRDRETIQTKMAGKDYTAGKFAHTLRIRLMREHLGVHVDIVDIVERRFRRFEEHACTSEGIKAATNHFKDSKYRILSAMVELASRDILGESEGTFRWKTFQKVNKSDLVADPVPMEDIDELEAQDNNPTPIPLPISFNNRTGTYEANRGIRDKKKQSYDARVQHSEVHKRDVYGLGLDKYKTRLAKTARLNSTRFLKDLTHKIMKTNPHSTVLPDIENIAEFLEGDDFDMSDEMDEDSERIIHERNKERWVLLKKVSYLQRVSATQREYQDEENKKRAKAGMPPVNLFGGPSPPSSADSKVDEKTKPVSSVEGSVEAPKDISEVTGIGSKPTSASSANTNGTLHQNGSAINGSHSNGHPSTTNLPSNDKKPDSAEFSANVPIVSLNEAGAQALINSISPKDAGNFTKFVDPYSFEDPISFDFYEDLWFEHARRNTEIFRMVFHTQPDDTVLTWADYKGFSKLQKAFITAQMQDSKRKSERHLFGENSSEDSDQESENEMRDSNDTSGSTGINIGSAKNETVTLGQPTENISKKSSFKFVYHNTIPEDPELSGELADGTELGLGSGSNGVANGSANGSGFTRRRRAFSSRKRVAAGDRIFDRETAERILSEIQGNLVIFPTDWLSRELDGGNWFYNTDRIPPIDIYD
ncbi:Phospholipase D1 [Yamadazyma tenuis]|nr:Phospholipase D1 [Yamadazyma tenuis]